MAALDVRGLAADGGWELPRLLQIRTLDTTKDRLVRFAGYEPPRGNSTHFRGAAASPVTLYGV